jgi:hypothetical protein
VDVLRAQQSSLEILLRRLVNDASHSDAGALEVFDRVDVVPNDLLVFSKGSQQNTKEYERRASL